MRIVTDLIVVIVIGTAAMRRSNKIVFVIIIIQKISYNSCSLSPYNMLFLFFLFGFCERDRLKI